MSDRISAPIPEPNPFMITICAGFLEDNIRVQLFSKPQHMQASRTNKDPQENCKLLISSKDSNKLESVTRTMANHNFLLIASMKIINAIKEVATISKLFSSEAFAALHLVNPIIKKIGAAISKTTIATVYGSSFFVKGSSFLCLLNFSKRYIPIPAGEKAF